MISPPTPSHSRRPLRLATGVLHLAFFGTVGLTVILPVLVLFVTSIGLIPVFGIGLVMLVGIVFALFGVAWFETQRVTGLYGLDTPELRLVTGRQQGFGGYLRWLWRQSINGRVWRGVSSFACGSLLGVLALGFVQQIIGAIFAMAAGHSRVLWFRFDPELSTLVGSITIGVSLAAIMLIMMLHRIVSIAIIDGGDTEAELRDRVQETTEKHEGAMRAAEVERTRIERDLHDGVQPRLVSIGMTLGLARETLDDNPEGAKMLIDEAHASTKAAVTELRELARGIYTSVLDDRGLDAALSALAARSHIPVYLDVQLGAERPGRTAETAMYFVIAEALTNAAKHSFANSCWVTLRAHRGESGAASYLSAQIVDNGVGGARVLPGAGLDGIYNRVTAVGGSMRLDSPAGGPTTLEVTVPCAS